MGGSTDAMADHQSRPRRYLMLPFCRRQQIAAESLTHLDVFFGSLTGTSQRLAASLIKKAAQRGVVVSLSSLADFDPVRFTQAATTHESLSRVMVFVVSTHFAGGASPDAENFSHWLRLESVTPSPVNGSTLLKGPSCPTEDSTRTSTSSAKSTPGPRRAQISPLPLRQNEMSDRAKFSLRSRPGTNLNWQRLFRVNSDSNCKRVKSFSRIQYAVFGVGSSKYLTYNSMGKFVDARLLSLGAVRVCPLGLGDILADLDTAFSKWEAQLLRLLVNNPNDPTLKASTRTTSTVSRVYHAPLLSGGSEGQLFPPFLSNLDHVMTPSTEQQQMQRRKRLDARRNSSATTMLLQRRPSLAPIPLVSSATSSKPVKFTILDKYGQPVRLHLRCRFLCSSRCNEIKEKDSRVLWGEGRGAEGKSAISASYAACAAMDTRGTCVALKSMKLLQGSKSNSRISDEMAVLRLAFKDPGILFKTADMFGYFPPNSQEIVDTVGKLLSFDMDAYVEFFFQGESSVTPSETASQGHHLPFPTPCTVRMILSNFLELRTVSREFVRIAAGFVSEPKEHELLANLASTDGSAAFNKEFTPANGGLLKLLRLAPSFSISLEILINILPLIKPRMYFIASSNLVDPHAFDVVVALGDRETTHGSSVSNFRHLLAQTDNDCFPLPTPMLRGFISSSPLKAPTDRLAPVVMIADGIGVAPLRALLQHRQIQDRVSESTGEPRSRNILLLGYSDKSSMPFEEELRNWEAQGFVELHLAFSASPEEPRCHIHDLVAAQQQQISATVANSSEAQILVCGDAIMIRSVREVLEQQEDAAAEDSWFKKVVESGRYVEGIMA